MARYSITKVQQFILERIPQGRLILKPGENHVYFDPLTGADYVSVTTRLHVLNNPSFINWRLNRGLEYIYDHHKEITPENKNDIFKAARNYPEQLFKEAGERGGKTHDYIDLYFKRWIESGVRPDILTLCTQEQDFAVWSALRSIETWVKETGYIPLVSEIQVWSEKYQVAGTVDAIGVINNQLVLCDWKTSTSLRTGYWFQVGAYWGMFKELTRIAPKRAIIVRLDKDQGIPEAEEVTDLPKRWKEFRKVADLYTIVNNLEKQRNHRETIKL